MHSLLHKEVLCPPCPPEPEPPWLADVVLVARVVENVNVVDVLIFPLVSLA